MPGDARYAGWLRVGSSSEVVKVAVIIHVAVGEDSVTDSTYLACIIDPGLNLREG